MSQAGSLSELVIIPISTCSSQRQAACAHHLQAQADVPNCVGAATMHMTLPTDVPYSEEGDPHRRIAPAKGHLQLGQRSNLQAECCEFHIYSHSLAWRHCRRHCALNIEAAVERICYLEICNILHSPLLRINNLCDALHAA